MNIESIGFIILGGFMGFMLSLIMMFSIVGLPKDWPEKHRLPTVREQQTCGIHKAQTAWSRKGRRLVICEHPSGLIVREVK
jgi:hypothetical protein